MDQKLVITPKFKIAAFVLMAIGVAAFILAFMTEPERGWANLMINNYYFVALAVGATFFVALQSIVQAGWSVAFNRIPHAIANFFPVLLVLMIPIVFFGLHSIYHWSHEDAVAHDALIAHKSPYLNVPFFIGRLLFYFAVWICMTQLLRKYSFKEDVEGGLSYFNKS